MKKRAKKAVLTGLNAAALSTNRGQLITWHIADKSEAKKPLSRNKNIYLK
ncbi:DUF1589 domain-containing protein [Paenibacillus sepulcri]